MKTKHLIAILALAALTSLAHGQSKVSERPALAAIDLAPATDILPIVDVSAGTAGSKKITIDNLFTGWGATAFGKSLVTAADVAAAKTILGYGTAADATLGGDAGEVPVWITAPIVPSHVVVGAAGSQITSMLFADLKTELAVPTVPAYASQAEAEAGTENTKLMTPLRVAEAITALGGGGGGMFASQVEAETGTDATKYMNPLRTAQAIAALAPAGSVTATNTVTLTNKTLSTGTVFSSAPTMTLGSDGTGDVYYRDAGGLLTRLAAGTNGHVLTLASGLPSWAAAAGGGLTNWTESVNTSAPNATVPVVRLLATNAATNVDIALTPKGSGAVTAHVADSTAAGGNKRGTNAVDLQTIRGFAANVASGSSSVIGGGSSNQASGLNCTIAGGHNNTATGSRSTIAGGATNQSTATSSFVGAGEGNTASGGQSGIVAGNTVTVGGTYGFAGAGLSITASGNYAVICGGQSNSTSGAFQHQSIVGGSGNSVGAQYAFVGAGLQNSANGDSAVVAGGRNNEASGARSMAGGQYASTRGLQTANAWAGGRFAATGDAQSTVIVYRRETTDATTSGLSADSAAPAASSSLVMPNNSTYRFTATVVGRTSAGVSDTVELKGAIKRGANAASTAIIGTVGKDTVQDAGAAAWTVDAVANTTLGSLEIQVTGAAATTIRWVARIETTEVVY